MKFNYFIIEQIIQMSPSTRREWIEIVPFLGRFLSTISLPPRGGSGLKFNLIESVSVENESPSTRREWIEIENNPEKSTKSKVSLHAEGVD